VSAKRGLLLLLVLAGVLIARPVYAQDEREQVRQALLAQINADRGQYNLPPLQLEALACLAAEAHAAEMLAGDYLSHWNEAGFSPYHRYSLAGGYHYGEENLFYYEQRGGVDSSAAGLMQLCLLGEASFMAEKPPRDGHRRSLLNPWHTHLGIGFAASPDSFRLVLLFTRHLTEEFSPAERVFSEGQPIQVSGQVAPGYALHSIAIFYEPWPQRLELRGKKGMASYSLPKERSVHPSIIS